MADQNEPLKPDEAAAAQPAEVPPAKVPAAGDGDKPGGVAAFFARRHDPEMAGSNYYIDHWAWGLAAGVIGLIFVAAVLVAIVASAGLPPPEKVNIPAGALYSEGQKALIKEADNQLSALQALSRNYEILAMVMGATAAALTVIVGFIKEHTKSKMFLMAASAALSVFIGTVNPAEKATRFMDAWDQLYAQVNITNAKTTLTEADFLKLAAALARKREAEAAPTPQPPQTPKTPQTPQPPPQQ